MPFHLLICTNILLISLHLRAYYLGIYSLLGGIQAIFVVMAAIAFALATMKASRILHYRMLANILRAPMAFFDTTPVGRILNRFSKDIYTIDETIPLSLDDFLLCFFTVAGAIIVVAIVTPVFTTVMPPLVIFYWITQVHTTEWVAFMNNSCSNLI